MAHFQSENSLTDRQCCFLHFVSFLIPRTGGLICLSTKGLQPPSQKRTQTWMRRPCHLPGSFQNERAAGQRFREIWDLQGAAARGKWLLHLPMAPNAASWLGHSQHGGSPTDLSYFPWHSCWLNPHFGVHNSQLTTSWGPRSHLEWGGNQSTQLDTVQGS